MKKLFLLTIILSFTLSYATDVVHDEDYFKHEHDNIEIIFTKDNLPFAKETNAIEPTLKQIYQKHYHWKLDETLYVGLLSHKNQIPNGYSTQWPNNRQINYIGGAQNIDYFCSTSWLDTLLYHESAHNYQINVKANGFSRFLHSVFGNGYVMLPMPLSVPNVMENPFMLEGNAVLNESIHGNGGRLYSGRFKAQTILQAKAGLISPQKTYNTTLNFPYSEIHYITGAFYNLYMAEKHGLDKLNRYFHQHSKLFIWPQLTNHSMKVVTGEAFESSLKEFASEYASKELNVAEGKRLFSSQYYYQLDSDNDEIYFIANETALRAPQLVVVNKHTYEIKTKRDSWLGGKVIKKDDSYYTIGSNYTSAFGIYQGLYDSDAHLLKSTRSKIIHGYLSDGKEVYFDVKSSFSQPQLYVGDSFYAQVNSSVHIDANDNLYYFKQKGKTRTLYKNKKALYSYKGFYGIVNDVDAYGNIYFIANTKNGSTLYRYSPEDAKVIRATDADNILEAKLLDNNKIFLSAIGDDEYYYLISDMQEIDEKPYETKLFFEDKDYYAKANYNNIPDAHKHNKIDLDSPYNSFLDMHYSGIDIVLGSNVGNISINFGDPLGQNAASVFANRDDSNVTIAGANYTSKQFFVNYSLLGYRVLDDYNRKNTRDYGVMADANIPLLRFSRYFSDITLSYFQDYDTLEREPISLSMKLSRYEKYGKSMYTNYLNSIELFEVKERDDYIYGGRYDFIYDFPYEFYINIGAKYSKTSSKITSTQAFLNTRGVKISDASSLSYDKSQINIPNLAGSFYIQSAGYADIKLSKVINLSKYFFTFPLSIQRESIYSKYRYYELESFSNKLYKMNEATLGTTISLVGLNSLAFPISFEYIYNDADEKLVDDMHMFRFILGVDF